MLVVLLDLTSKGRLTVRNNDPVTIIDFEADATSFGDAAVFVRGVEVVAAVFNFAGIISTTLLLLSSALNSNVPETGF